MPTPAPNPADWLSAAREPAVCVDLEAIFDDAAGAIAARGPACWASGRCCNFESSGHRLYTTALEAAYTLVRAGSVADEMAARDAGSRGPTVPRGGAREGGSISLVQVGEARARGGCPFQVRNLCGVHAIKPIACRVYFCDRSAQAWQHELSERLHDRVRALHAARGIPYLYAEWRGLLEMLVGAMRPGSRGDTH